MKQFFVSANYATWAGNFASCNRTVAARDEREAMQIVASRIEKFKRYQGKLSMSAVEVDAISEAA